MKTLATLALVVATTTPAWAQFAKPEDAIKYRQSAMFVMQQNFSRVAAMASGKLRLTPRSQRTARRWRNLSSRLPWAGFGEGTDKGRDNRAKAEIWSDKAKFNDYAEKIQAEMVKLSVAMKTGNLDAIKPAVRSVGGTCKTCHDAFQKD